MSNESEDLINALPSTRMRKMKARIEELEAQLSKAMEALDRLDHLTAKDAAIVVSTLSELKGKANE